MEPKSKSRFSSTLVNFFIAYSSTNPNPKKPTKQPIQRFICPISGTIMSNPVKFVLDDQIYDYDSIANYIKTKHRSPYNYKELPAGYFTNDLLVPQASLLQEIQQFVRDHSDKINQIISLPV